VQELGHFRLKRLWFANFGFRCFRHAVVPIPSGQIWGMSSSRQAHKKTAGNHRPLGNSTPHVQTLRNATTKSARLEQSAQGGWGAWNRSAPSRAIEATQVLSSCTLAKARRKWGKIEKFAQSLVKSHEAFQNDDHMTGKEQRGFGHGKCC
jgi:hypothetical protein